MFSDVERWPEWTPTVDSVERLDEGRIHIGAKTRIRQPKLPVAIWEVTELDEGEYFEWVSNAPGIKTTGGHRVVSDAGRHGRDLDDHPGGPARLAVRQAVRRPHPALHRHRGREA